MTDIDRSAIGRAKFFMELARECKAHQINEFEAFLEASIIFTRAAILRVQAKHEKHPNFKAWFAGLKSNPSIVFIKDERNLIAHEAPPKLGQVIGMDTLNPITYASQLRFYETNESGEQINAITTLSRHIAETEKIVLQSEEVFR